MATAKKSAKKAAPKAAPAKAAAGPKVGDRAPDFTLPTDTGTITLSALKGKAVVVYFYPRDDTPGCTVEACEFTAENRNAKRGHATMMTRRGRGATPRTKKPESQKYQNNASSVPQFQRQRKRQTSFASWKN